MIQAPLRSLNHASGDAINHEPAFARLPPKRTCSGQAKSVRFTRKSRTDRAHRYLRVALTDETAIAARPNASACRSARIGRYVRFYCGPPPCFGLLGYP